MVDKLIRIQQSTASEFRFSLLIPTWNNLAFLQTCIRSIRLHSVLPLQIIVIINEGRDGTKEWVESQMDIDYVYAPENIGICYALNSCRSLINSNYVVYLNDDMYVLPGWDKALDDEIQHLGHKSFMLSSTMIEPIDTGNPCVSVKDFGRNPANFQEEKLLQEFASLTKENWAGATWPPNIMHIELWDLVGGMSIEFSPGMYSDPDLSMKLMQAGVKTFKGLGNSLVYHFGKASTGRVRKNKGELTFLLKWGISSGTFTKMILKRGQQFNGDTVWEKPPFSRTLKDRWKKIKTLFTN